MPLSVGQKTLLSLFGVGRQIPAVAPFSSHPCNVPLTVMCSDLVTEVNPPSITGGLSVEVVVVFKLPGDTLMGECLPMQWYLVNDMKVVLFK